MTCSISKDPGSLSNCMLISILYLHCLVNMLIIESLERYDFFYGDSLLVECPTGSGNKMRLKDVSVELARRLGKLFLKDGTGRRACHGQEARYRDDKHWNDLVLFYEFFDAENGRGCGARYVKMATSILSFNTINI